MDKDFFKEEIISLEDTSPFEKVFASYSLVVIGTLEEDGVYNLAPKHMVTPVGWSGYFGFACSPDHHTTKNIKRTEEFTVSYPHPDEIVSISLSAEPRDDKGHKPDLSELETVDSPKIDAEFIKNSYIYLECELKKIFNELGENNFIIGEIIGKYIDKNAIRTQDKDDAETIHNNPILAYLHPGRYSKIDSSNSFPFPKNFKK